jgi:hypothetical protein
LVAGCDGDRVALTAERSDYAIAAAQFCFHPGTVSATTWRFMSCRDTARVHPWPGWCCAPVSWGVEVVKFYFRSVTQFPIVGMRTRNLWLGVTLIAGWMMARYAQADEKVRLPLRTVTIDELNPYYMAVSNQLLPFELSPEMLDPNGPVIPQCAKHEGKVYDKTVAVGWSGENDWAQFLNALGTFGQAMKGSDEVYIFAGMAPPPDRNKYNNPEDYEIAYAEYQLSNDYERVKNNPTDFKSFHMLNQESFTKHNADSSSLISLLERLYREALAGKKIQLTMMVSNHGTFVVSDKSFEMQSIV